MRPPSPRSAVVSPVTSGVTKTCVHETPEPVRRATISRCCRRVVERIRRRAFVPEEFRESRRREREENAAERRAHTGENVRGRAPCACVRRIARRTHAHRFLFGRRRRRRPRCGGLCAHPPPPPRPSPSHGPCGLRAVPPVLSRGIRSARITLPAAAARRFGFARPVPPFRWTNTCLGMVIFAAATCVLSITADAGRT